MIMNLSISKPYFEDDIVNGTNVSWEAAMSCN